MNPKTRIIFLISLTIIVLFVLGDTFFIVSEMNQVIITQFGEPVSGTISKPGIHTKLPFVQDVHSFEKRWLEWEGDSNQIPTKDKKYIWVETYARWRIHDPLIFFQRVRDERGAVTARRHHRRRDQKRHRQLRPHRDRSLFEPEV